ncbi:MAG: PilN domain-containing protein [Candidatus Omnitrophota bacterium]
MRKGYLAIDIYGPGLRWVFAEPKGRSLRIVRSGVCPAPQGFLQPGALRTVLVDLFREEEIAVKRIFVSYSDPDTLIHKAVFPKMTQAELKEAVTAEIERVPSFEDRPFDFVFTRRPLPDDKEQIIFAAVLQESLDRIMDEIRETGIPADHLELAPIHLDKVFSLIQRPDVPEKSQSELSSGVEAVIVVHEQASSVLLSEDGHIEEFFRSSAGMHQIKKGTDPSGIVKQWTSEFVRMMRSYEEVHGGKRVQRVWLVWDKTRLEDLPRAFERAMPIEIIEPKLEWISRLETAGESDNPLNLVALTPLICAWKKMRTRVSLQHFFRRMQTRKTILTAAVITAVLIAGMSLGLKMYTQQLTNKVERVKQASQIEMLEIKGLKKEAQELYAEQKEFLENQQRLLEQAMFVRALNRVSWAQVLSEYAREMPEDLALTHFRFADDGKATIKGQSFDMDSVAEMIRRIEDSDILENGMFDFLKERTIRDQQLYEFGIVARLKRQKEVPESEYE